MLLEVAKGYRFRLLVVYALCSAGMLAALLYPLATALAIDGVLSGSYSAVIWLVACHAAQLVLTVASKRLDTRVFTRMFGSLASMMVERSRRSGLSPARVAARVALSREYTVFLEEDVPRIIYAVTALAVSMGALGLLEPRLALTCLMLGAPLLIAGRWLAHTSSRLNIRLNNRLEQEVGLLSAANPLHVRRHFQAISGWRIKLSDAEAAVFGVMELLVIILFAAALWQVGTASENPRAGEVYAIFSYIWRFVGSLDQVPVLIQKLAKLGDLDRRLTTESVSA